MESIFHWIFIFIINSLVPLIIDEDENVFD